MLKDRTPPCAEEIKGNEVGNMRKILRRAMLGSLCCVLLCVCVFADNSITEMKTDCNVEPDGTCRITQTLTLNLETSENELHFPLGAGAKKPEIAGYQAKQYIEDGITCLRLSSTTGFAGSRTFTVTYTLEDLVTEADGVQTLDIPLLCAKWEYPIEHYDFTVMMPQAFDAKPSFLSGYRGDVIEDFLTLRAQSGVLDGSVTTALKDRESLNLTLELESGYFSGAYAKWSASWVATAFLIVFALLALVYWALMLRSAPLRVVSRNLPPDSTQPGDIPYLLCCGKSSFNMTVCHWASLGYLSVLVSRKGDVALRRRVEMGNERRKLDQKLFALLFGGGDTCDGASMTFKRTAAKAIEATPRFWQRRLYQKNSGSVLIMRALCALCAAVAMLLTMSMLLPVMTARWLLLFLCFILGGALSVLIMRGFAAWQLRDYVGLGLAAAAGLAMLILARAGGGIVTMLAAVALSLFTGWQTLHGGRRTALGNQFIEQTLGFRRYLRRITNNHIKTMLARDPQYFYRTLPYAEAMGMGAEFAARFAALDLEPCEWFSEEKEAARNSKEFYSHWKEALAMLEVSIRK